MAFKTFDDAPTWVGRAQQIYMILTARAATHSLITYGDLSEMVYGHYSPGYTMAGPLDLIAYWTRRNGLSELTSLIVNKDTGLPTNPPGVSPASWQHVFATKWFKIVPPTEDELIPPPAGYFQQAA